MGPAWIGSVLTPVLTTHPTPQGCRPGSHRKASPDTVRGNWVEQARTLRPRLEELVFSLGLNPFSKVLREARRPHQKAQNREA